MKKTTAILLLLTLLLCAGCALLPAEPDPTAAPVEETPAPAEETPAPAEETPAPAEETAAPDAEQTGLAFTTTTLSGEAIDGGVIKDYDLVILNFWAEWCGPCVEELPALEQIHEKYPNVLIIGAWIGDDAQAAVETLNDAGVTYPAVYPEGALLDYAVKSMYIPATYFFDRDGNEIGEPVIGGQNFSQWENAVKGLLP